ncbi:MAG: type II secretion system protein [Arhodomonas sp.]|nr:type II secretion system protein [Arhodomonas sp.]
MSDRHQGGFSLLELLVAFTIMAVALTVVLQAISGGLRNTAVAEDYARALQIAERQLTLAEAASPVPEGSEEGTVGERCRWSQGKDPPATGLGQAISRKQGTGRDRLLGASAYRSVGGPARGGSWP